MRETPACRVSTTTNKSPTPTTASMRSPRSPSRSMRPTIRPRGNGPGSRAIARPTRTTWWRSTEALSTSSRWRWTRRTSSGLRRSAGRDVLSGTNQSRPPSGGYYFTQDVSYREGRHILAALRPAPLLQGLGGDIDHSTWAAFGRLSWELSDRWTLNAGLRYTSEEKSTQQSLGANCNPLNFAACNFGIHESQDWSNLGGDVSAQYFLSDDVQFYTSYSRGFRSGGYNLRNAVATADPAYDEEVVDSYEIGVKSDVLDRLRVNLAVFRAVYSDLQRTVLLSDGSQQIGNSGKATVDGIEIEANWLVTEIFAVDLSYGYLDGGYDELDAGALAGFNATRASSGLGPLTTSQFDLARAPGSTASLSLTLDQPLSNNGVISYRLMSTYRDEFAANDANTLYAPSYTDLNANITYRNPNGRWGLSLWGKTSWTRRSSSRVATSRSSTSSPSCLGPRYGVDLRGSF
ncbi:MAG: TonB-dependent receptor [Proteobacteria bacterium]|nr:TonB-dependent receptor [Pseudomonadota bacterium]